MKIKWLLSNMRLYTKTFWREKIVHTGMTKCPQCKHRTLVKKFSSDYCSRKRCNYYDSKRGNMFTGGISIHGFNIFANKPKD